MELNAHDIREVFTEILQCSEDPDLETINLRDFKKLIEGYGIELYKGVELTDEDFHECCRQLFSQLCQKNNSRLEVTGASSRKNRFKSPSRELSNTLKFSTWKSKNISSSLGRKEWVKSGKSSANKSPKNQTLTSLKKLRDDKKKAKHSSPPKELEEPKEIEHIIVEEERLDFDTFKANYTELATVRTLVQAIHERVEKNKKKKYDTLQYPKHILIDLEKPAGKENMDSTEELNDVDEYKNEIRAQTGRSIQFKTKNDIYVQNPIIRKDPKARKKWDKKEPFGVQQNSSSEDMDDLYMLQKKIQIIQEAEDDSESIQFPPQQTRGPMDYHVEETSERRKIILKTPQKHDENSQDIEEVFNSASKTRFVIINDDDQNNAVPHVAETPVRLNDINFKEQESEESGEEYSKQSHQESSTTPKNLNSDHTPISSKKAKKSKKNKKQKKEKKEKKEKKKKDKKKEKKEKKEKKKKTKTSKTADKYLIKTDDPEPDPSVQVEQAVPSQSQNDEVIEQSSQLSKKVLIKDRKNKKKQAGCCGAPGCVIF
ncbi:unnamed protein product [Moneuplotes crassus]|uniref:Uncharacterized protein n=1 Tax=Euplotes crassus TaxID=5936 RepID=A0AAD1X4N6_EUPCR|nr:unnamed protein product [Moneuplotes crassus]